MKAENESEWAALYRQRFGQNSAADEPDSVAVKTAAGILGRRTLRRYLDRPIEPELITLLLMAAQSAPAKSDLQQYSIVHVTDPGLRKTIGDMIPGMPWVASAPGFFIFCGDMRRNRRITQMRKYDHANDNVDTFMNAAVDSGIAMATMISAAESLGLGCCPISVVRNHIDKIVELLAIPAGVFPVAGLTVGWPADPGHVSMRLPPSLVVHENAYDDSGLETAVMRYDAERRRRHPIAPEKQRHVDRYGVNPECGWSENAARQLSVPERSGFRTWLASRGINLR